MASKAIEENLFKNIGYLFYSIAAADKKVRNEEREILRKFLHEKWFETDGEIMLSATDSAQKIEFVFDYLVQTQTDSYIAFSEFEIFFKKHKKIFTPQVKLLIWEVANRISLAFSEKNKSELVILSKLEILFKRN